MRWNGVGRDRTHRRLRGGAVALALLILCAASPARTEPRLTIDREGPEVVFRGAVDGCERYDFPDGAARAFRDAGGRVHLIATHFVNRAMVGPALDRVRRNCRVIFKGGEDGRPEAFDDRGWLLSVYTADGADVIALVHNEFQGHRRPALCPSRIYRSCWYNTITFARSRDGGLSFQAPTGAARLVAALPYPYEPDAGRRRGFSSPSNMIEVAGYVYALIVADAVGVQKAGVCIMRTDRPQEPGSWRAWDGRAYSVRFANPYDARQVPDAAAHVCAPVAGLAAATVGAVVRHAASGRFVAVQGISAGRGGDGRQRSGVYVSYSADLVSWSVPELAAAVPIFDSFACDDTAAFGYPSLLDPDSPSRIFDTVGDAFYLYMTRFNLKDCKRGEDRDLVRFRARLAP
jgi:hypothetical protein